MAEIILPETEAISEEFNYTGMFKIVCLKYASDPVNLQIRDRDLGGTWVQLRDQNTAIRFDREGEAWNVVLTRGFTYRLHSDSAGSIIAIDRHRGDAV